MCGAVDLGYIPFNATSKISSAMRQLWANCKMDWKCFACLLCLHCQHGQSSRWFWLNPLLSVWLSVSDCVYSLRLFSLFGVSLQICETTKVYPFPYPLRNSFFCDNLVTYQWAILPCLPLLRYCSPNAYTAACWLPSCLMWEVFCSWSFYTDEDFQMYYQPGVSVDMVERPKNASITKIYHFKQVCFLLVFCFDLPSSLLVSLTELFSFRNKREIAPCSSLRI